MKQIRKKRSTFYACFRLVRSAKKINAVDQSVREYPSTCRFSLEVNISRTSLRRIFHKYLDFDAL